MANELYNFLPFVRAYNSETNPINASIPTADRSTLSGVFENLYRSNASKQKMAQMLKAKGAGANVDDFLAQQAKFMADPLNSGTGSLKNTASLVGANLKTPAALGTVANVGTNVAGLLDNDKIGGQLIGAAVGAGVPALLGAKLGPLAYINLAAGGGNIGALFDTLRAKKADERAQYGKEEYVR
jgi:hypothetical protein